MRVVRLFITIILVIMIIAWISSAAITVIPDSTASKDCFIGYRAHCSFTPYSTIISLIGGFVTYLLARICGFLKFK